MEKIAEQVRDGTYFTDQIIELAIDHMIQKFADAAPPSPSTTPPAAVGSRQTTDEVGRPGHRSWAESSPYAGQGTFLAPQTARVRAMNRISLFVADLRKS
ncbi:MAG: hypothetical protein AAFX76_09225, partial [Planctomycetota bacterium]